MARRDAVAELLPADLLDPGGHVQRPALFDAPQNLFEKLGWVDVRDGPVSDEGEDVDLEAPGYVSGVVRRPARKLVFVPFERHGLEGVLRVAHGLTPFPFPCTRRVCPLRQQLLGPVTAFAGVGKADNGIHTQRQPLLFAEVTVLHPPAF